VRRLRELNVVEVDRQADGMKIKSADLRRVALQVGVHLAFGVAA